MITRVNPQLCAGHKVCNVVCPEVFELDEFGYAFVKEGMESPPEELWDKVREAARECPEDAIVVVRPQEIEDESLTGKATLYVVLTRATQLLSVVS